MIQVATSKICSEDVLMVTRNLRKRKRQEVVHDLLSKVDMEKNLRVLRRVGAARVP